VLGESVRGRKYTPDIPLPLFSVTCSKVITVFMDENGWTYQRDGWVEGGGNVYKILTGKT
jgi:hypothetical protein